MAEEKDEAFVFFGMDYTKLVFHNYPKLLKSKIRKNPISFVNINYLFVIFEKELKLHLHLFFLSFFSKYTQRILFKIRVRKRVQYEL